MGIADMQESIWQSCTKLGQYTNSTVGTQRSKWLVGYIKNLNFNSVFEVGCCTARNLNYIHKSFPDVKIGGLDINKKALKQAYRKAFIERADTRTWRTLPGEIYMGRMFLPAEKYHVYVRQCGADEELVDQVDLKAGETRFVLFESMY